MLTTGEYIRGKLIEASDGGVCIADLQTERRAKWRELDLIYRGGRYHSLARYFYWLVQLGWVETVRTEASYRKGDTQELKAPRTFYRITTAGLGAESSNWRDLLAANHPDLHGGARKTKYVIPSGKPRGRPRVAKEKVVKKPPKVKERKKVPAVELEEEEKLRLLFEFRETFGREPTTVEKKELFAEELKIKKRRKKGG